eukprot:CAMPEP_0205918654 /NCGR_PEP_ID=MMETSP1325-20131115/9939_1 /ASSEMBLY_ACC=CAM_ASM_000708 /TAXON_ID=236786 /ORGANISM="Florenciella sp., Strain RCC1007" /LENGTH=122 /DNA_ID=CAMNT_0053286205 /DNA_START=43 /DNA_END=411 /DNA_ORIENTATION=-
MKLSISICTILSAFLVRDVSAFVPGVRPTRLSPRIQHLAAAEMTPEISSAADQVRACARKFGPETEHFANVWISQIMEGGEAKMAGLLDECLVDDSSQDCQEFDSALKKFGILMGISWPTIG